MRSVTSSLLGVIATATLMPSCSFLLELEPDCDAVSDCTPYVCNAENTACRSFCRDDDECAPGFLCARNGDDCISQGCVPTGPVVSVFSLEGGGSFDYDVARIDDTFHVVVGSADGVGVLHVSFDGVASSDGFTVLDTDAGAPSDPLAIATDEGATVFWRGEPGTNVFDLRVFHIDRVTGPSGPRIAYVGSRGQALDGLVATRLDDALLVGWSTFVDRIQVQVLPLNLDGTYGQDVPIETAPNEAAVTITEAATGSSLPALAATVERPAVVRRETESGSNSVVSSFLDSELMPINNHTLAQTPGTRIEGIHASGMSNAVAVAWMEDIDGQRVILRAVDGDTGTILPGTVSQDFTTEPDQLDVAAGTTEFALLWSAQDFDGGDIFMRRFDELGQPLFVTFSASGRSVIDPTRPNVVRTPDGYAVFWIERAVEPPSLQFRRFVCAR